MPPTSVVPASPGSTIEHQHVIVVGGGLAGLAAAEALVLNASPPTGSVKAKAWSVTLIEPTGRLGGVLATVRQGGWLVERSADSFLTARPEAIAMVERLGISSELISINPQVRRALIYQAGRTLPVPAGFRLLAPGRIDSIVASDLLSPLGKLRLLVERFVPARAIVQELPFGGDDESLEHFAVRRLGREAFERIVQPLVSGIWTADPQRLSMAAACPEFFEMERQSGSLSAGERKRLRKVRHNEEASGARYGQFVSFASGMERLPTVLGEYLEQAGVQRVTATVKRLVRRTNGGWELSISSSENAEGLQTILADAVVLAVPSREASHLLADIDKPLADELATIQYAGSAVVSLGFARNDLIHPLDAAGVVVPRSAGRKALAISFSSSKFSGRAPTGSVLLRVFVGGALDPATALLPDDQLLSVALAEVSAVLGSRGKGASSVAFDDSAALRQRRVQSQPQFVQIDRWAGAIPQYHVGHLQTIDRIKQRLVGVPGLAIAGAAYEGVGIPQVIASGQAAAAQLASQKPRQ
ncbi:MAG: protoporphyrinogen oxidase [Planctomycetota bacterium]